LSSNPDRDSRIFEEELFPHIDALKTFAFHLTYNDADADDLVQETYMKAHRFIDKYMEGTNAKAWLFKILKNAYINEYRKKSKQPSRVDFEDFRDFLEHVICSKKSFKDMPRKRDLKINVVIEKKNDLIDYN